MSLIALSGLTRHYPRGVVALDGLTLELEPGIIGLVGANGAGKSTLIKILLGLLQPTSGDASVMGLDVRTQGTTIRQFVGYMPEYDCLPPDTSATDFVTHMARMSGLPSTAARERTAEVLRHVGLYEERYRAIGGYSTGMKQRVKLAQALVHDPRLLLLDEPTNGLDPAGRDEMLGLVRRTGTEFGIAVVVASHLLGEIERVCDFLVAIDAGRLLRAAPLGSFTERTGVLAIEVEEGEAALTGALIARGLQAVADGRTVLIAVTDDKPFDIVRDAVAELGLPLVRLEQRRQSLEDLFRDAPPVGSVGGGAPAAPVRRHPRPGQRRGPGQWRGASMSGSPLRSATTNPTSASGPGGSIYDLGYQSYQGPRLGRRSAVVALYTQSLRACFGIGRGGRAKIAPFTLAGLAILPAVLAVGFAALAAQAGPGGDAIEQASPIRYDSYHGLVSVLIMLFCAAQAPELFGRDQRYGVLPLYFSRVLTRTDYALAKVGGLMTRPAHRRAGAVPGAVPGARARRPGPGHRPRRRDRERPALPAPGRPDGRPVRRAGQPDRGLDASPRLCDRGDHRRAHHPADHHRHPRHAGDGRLARLAVLLSPADILAGTNAAIFGSIPDSDAVAKVDLPGWAYVAAAAVGIVASVGLTVRRYLRISA